MFRSPFSFNGRIRRLEYGLSFILYLIFYFLVMGIMNIYSESIFGLLGFIGIVPLAWFIWAQGAKRCHDLSNSGWYQIIPFYFILLIFQQGVMGENEYGDDPREPKQDFEYVRPEVATVVDEAPTREVDSKPLEEE